MVSGDVLALQRLHGLRAAEQRAAIGVRGELGLGEDAADAPVFDHIADFGQPSRPRR